MRTRLLIVCDGRKWYVRHVRVIEHDLRRGEKVYRCDQPLGKPYATLDEAVEAVHRHKGQRRPW